MSKLTIDREKLIDFLGLQKHKDELLWYIGNASYDLIYGPVYLEEEDQTFPWKGFSHGLARIKGLLTDAPSQVFYDNDAGEFLSNLPEGEMIDGEWQEPDCSEIYELNTLEVLAGKELASYI